MDNKLSAEEAIVKVSKEFIDDMRDNIFTAPEEEEELLLGECWLKSSQPAKILHLAIKHLLPHKKAIEEKNLQFFIDNKFIFNGLPPERVVYYSTKLASGKVPEEDMDVCFSFLKTMVDIADKAEKNKKRE